VLGTGQRSNDAAVEDVIIKPKKEEYARGTGRNLNSNYAALKDAQLKPV
jgi:hypothetical protein